MNLFYNEESPKSLHDNVSKTCHLSFDAANQASFMYDAWKRNKVYLTPDLAHSDPLSIEARISIK